MAGGRRGQGRAGRVPARGVAGGEDRGAREVEKVEANLLVGLGGRIGGRRVLVGDGQNAAAEVGGGCGVPAMDRRREVREKLHGFKAKLTEGLRRSGRCCAVGRRWTELAGEDGGGAAVYAEIEVRLGFI